MSHPETSFEIPDPELCASIEDIVADMLQDRPPTTHKGPRNKQNFMGLFSFALGQTKELGLVNPDSPIDSFPVLNVFPALLSRVTNLSVNPNCTWVVQRRVARYTTHTRGLGIDSKTRAMVASFASRIAFPEHTIFTGSQVARIDYASHQLGGAAAKASTTFGYTIFPGAKIVIVDGRSVETEDISVNDTLRTAGIVLGAFLEETR